MSGADPHPGRLERLRRLAGRAGASSLLVTSLPNVRWLCGFTGSSGVLLVTPREAVFFTDFRYREQGAREVRGARRVEYTGGFLEAVAAAVRKARISRLGFEADHLTFAVHAQLAAALPGTRLVPSRGSVEQLRAVKDAGEIGAIRRALRVAERASAVLSGPLSGLSEAAVAERLRRSIHQEGGDEESFPIIVASGPRGALPHAAPTGKIIRSGELVVVDFGVRLGGYCTDATRTLSPRKWGKRARMIYEIVLEAQNAAIAAVKPGVRASVVDKAARDVIERAGHGDHFGHGTGHGVGLEIHEKPTLSPKSGDILVPGMVITIEPGIYLKNFGGVRIEDMVLVTPTGREIMSRRIPKFMGPPGSRQAKRAGR